MSHFSCNILRANHVIPNTMPCKVSHHNLTKTPFMPTIHKPKLQNIKRCKKDNQNHEFTGLKHVTQTSLCFPFLPLLAWKFVPWQLSHFRTSPSSPSPFDDA